MAVLAELDLSCVVGLKDIGFAETGAYYGCPEPAVEVVTDEHGTYAYCAAHAPREDYDWDGDHIKTMDLGPDPWEGHPEPVKAPVSGPDAEAPF